MTFPEAGEWRPSMPFTAPSSKEMCVDVSQRAAVPRGVGERRQALHEVGALRDRIHISCEAFWMDFLRRSSPREGS